MGHTGEEARIFNRGGGLFTASSQKYSRDGNLKLHIWIEERFFVREKPFLMWGGAFSLSLSPLLFHPPSQWELRLDPKPPGDYSHSLSYGFKAVKVLHIYQEILLNPHQLLTKIMNALLLIVIYLQCTFRSIVISRQVLKDGLSSLDSQTAMARIGCVTMVDGGMTNTLPLEQRMTHQLTLIWYHLPFG